MALALLEAADAVLEAGGAGDRPRPGQGLLVAQVGPVLLVEGVSVPSLAVLPGTVLLRSVANFGSMTGRSATSGIRHGSEPLAR